MAKKQSTRADARRTPATNGVRTLTRRAEGMLVQVSLMFSTLRAALKASLYTRIALGLATVGIVAVALCIWAYWQQLHHLGLSGQSADWGTFGDFVGGIAGTLIALATLVALAFTLHLQADELAKTSAALDEQAKVTAQQLKLTREIELRRIRPLIKTEWSLFERGGLLLAIKNVGLGAAVIDKVEVHANKTLAGEITTDGASNLFVWRSAFSSILGQQTTTVASIMVHSLVDAKRGIAVGEHQPLVQLLVAPDVRVEAMIALNAGLEVLLYFRSLGGERFSTRAQFEFDPL